MPAMRRRPPKPRSRSVCSMAGGAGEHPATVIRHRATAAGNEDEWSAIGAANVPSAYSPQRRRTGIYECLRIDAAVD
jgi:hypothetical protein